MGLSMCQATAPSTLDEQGRVAEWHSCSRREHPGSSHYCGPCDAEFEAAW